MYTQLHICTNTCLFLSLAASLCIKSNRIHISENIFVLLVTSSPRVIYIEFTLLFNLKCAMQIQQDWSKGRGDWGWKAREDRSSEPHTEQAPTGGTLTAAQRDLGVLGEGPRAPGQHCYFALSSSTGAGALPAQMCRSRKCPPQPAGPAARCGA